MCLSLHHPQPWAVPSTRCHRQRGPVMGTCQSQLRHATTPTPSWHQRQPSAPTAQRAATTSGRGVSICCVMTTLLVLAGAVGLPAGSSTSSQSSSESVGSTIAASGSPARCTGPGGGVPRNDGRHGARACAREDRRVTHLSNAPAAAGSPRSSPTYRPSMRRWWAMSRWWSPQWAMTTPLHSSALTTAASGRSRRATTAQYVRCFFARALTPQDVNVFVFLPPTGSLTFRLPFCPTFHLSAPALRNAPPLLRRHNTDPQYCRGQDGMGRAVITGSS